MSKKDFKYFLEVFKKLHKIESWIFTDKQEIKRIQSMFYYHLSTFQIVTFRYGKKHDFEETKNLIQKMLSCK